MILFISNHMDTYNTAKPHIPTFSNVQEGEDKEKKKK